MTLYDDVSGNGFSSLQDPPTMFVASSWQMEETGFHPKFDLTLRQPEHDTDNDDVQDDVEDEQKPSPDALNQKISDAYAQGYLNGQQAIAAHLDEDRERQNALATAINRLKPADEAKLAKQLWEAVLSLFQQAVGNAKIDRELMQQRCAAALKSIATDVGEVCLYVAPGDVKILQDHDCAVPVVADPELLPGSVRLAYASGQITSGSLSIVQEIEARIGPVGGASC